jgi:Helix-turn-helix domain
MNRFLTTEELADLLRTSPETVRYWRHVDRWPASFKVGRRVLYAVQDVENVIEAARLRGRRNDHSVGHRLVTHEQVRPKTSRDEPGAETREPL